MKDVVVRQLNSLIAQTKLPIPAPNDNRWPGEPGLWVHYMGEPDWKQIGFIESVQLEKERDVYSGSVTGVPVIVPTSPWRSWVEPGLIVPTKRRYLENLMRFNQEHGYNVPRLMLRLSWDRWWLDFERVYLSDMPTLSVNGTDDFFQTALRFLNQGRSILWNRETGERWCYNVDGSCASYEEYKPETLSLPEPQLKLERK